MKRNLADRIVAHAIAGAEAGGRLQEVEAAILHVARTTAITLRDVVSDVSNLYANDWTTAEVLAYLRSDKPVKASWACRLLQAPTSILMPRRKATP